MVYIIILAAFFAPVIFVSSGTIPRNPNTISLPLRKSETPPPDTVVVGNNTLRLLEGNKARLEWFKGTATRAASAAGTTGTATATNMLVTYFVPVTIGSQVFGNMIVDTGSSNIWVGAGTKFVPGTTGKFTGESVSVTYGSGSFTGTEYTDTVTVGGLTVVDQSIGVAKTSSGFEGDDGIMGFGPTDLTQGTVAGSPTVPTFMDNLYKQGTIATEVLGIFLEDESGSDTNDPNGILTLGGTDASLYKAPITFTPRVGDYWGVAVSSVAFGTTSLGSISQAIVDTGTTLIYLPTALYNKYLSASDGTLDEITGLVKYSKQPTGNLSFTIGGTTFAMLPSGYLVPQAQYANLGLSSGSFYSWVNDGGSDTPSAILGMYFLTNFYSVYDTTNSRVGFAIAL